MRTKESIPFGSSPAALAVEDDDDASMKQRTDDAVDKGIKTQQERSRSCTGEDGSNAANEGERMFFEGMQVSSELISSSQLGEVDPSDGEALRDGSMYEEDESWEEADKFEALMTKASKHRAMLSQLPDDQRREKAAEIALQLMAMMGIDMEDIDENEEAIAE